MRPTHRRPWCFTNSGGDQRADWLVEKSKSAGFDIQVMNMGSGDLINRIIAEKNNPVADMVFGPNAVDFGKLVKADVLYKFSSSLQKVFPMYGKESAS
ncbi:MAG: hypothetical protein LBF95_10940 [Treponema sp.]|nr:hypothetical protein [Treponema sp.]